MKSLHSIFFFSIGFTILLISFRVLHFGSYSYLFLAGNLFLGWIPLFLSSLISPAQKAWTQCIVFFGWLIFFPNSFYLITDLVHLRERAGVPYWFDIFLVFSAVLNGVLMGYVSFMNMEKHLTQKFSSEKTTVIMMGCLFLCSFGIYIGRVLRWNSWDIIVNPTGLGSEVMYRVIHPFRNSGTWIMTVVLTLFFGVFYLAIRRMMVVVKSDNPSPPPLSQVRGATQLPADALL